MTEKEIVVDWFSPDPDIPQTQLEKKLFGKVYNHEMVCSGDRRKPIGSPGCCCLRRTKI